MTDSTTAAAFEPVWVWGVPFAPFTMEGTLERIDALIAGGGSHFFITANLNYVMLCDRDEKLRELNRRADFILCDGKPILWASKTGKPSLPERVAGSDLIPRLCQHAAKRGHGIFFLGGAPGTAEAAAKAMTEKHPGLRIAGIECPPHRALSPEEHGALLERIRCANAQILLVAYGQPKGEFWMDENLAKTGVPVAVQIGGTFDFLSGRIKRAPKWMQKVGLEWLYRWMQEPRRLAGRYTSNILFIFKMMFKGAFGLNRIDSSFKPNGT